MLILAVYEAYAFRRLYLLGKCETWNDGLFTILIHIMSHASFSLCRILLEGVFEFEHAPSKVSLLMLSFKYFS